MNVLRNKAYKDYSRLSRYGDIPYYYHTLDDKYITGRAAWLKNTTSYVSHKVRLNENLDTLALKYYNNPTYYWIIASFNRIHDPFEPLIPGTIMKIPSLSNIEFDHEG